MRLRYAAALIVALAQPTGLAAADESWTVSCSQSGNVVHLEKVTGPGADARHRQILARYPNATCVYLSDAVAPSIPVIAPAEGGDVNSLNQALMAITGGEATMPDLAPVEIATPPEPTTGLDRGVDTIESTPMSYPTTPDWVRLAVYKTDDVGVAVLDWKNLIALEPAFRAYQPTITRTEDGYVVLDVGPIAEEDLDAACLIAGARQMQCLRAPRTPGPVRTADAGARYLAYRFPTAVLPLGSDQQCGMINPAFTEAGGTTPDRIPSLTCWKSAFEAPAVFPDVPISLAWPPLPRPRPNR